jgi:hypothetical protein
LAHEHVWQQLIMNYRVGFFVFTISLLTAYGASACSWQKTTYEDKFRRAISIFTARVVRTEEKAEPSADIVDDRVVYATIKVVEMFKGQPPADGKIRSRVFSNGNCTIPIMAGNDYLIFLYDDSFVGFPGGSTVLPSLEADLQDEETKRVLRILTHLRDKR